MKLSIVATLYNSQQHLTEFCERCTNAARALVGDDYEIILVNDGSPDNSLEMAVNLFRSCQHIRVLDLSRNFGHHKAMMTGLAYARGELIYLLDSDLEERPEWLSDFKDRLDECRVDVVFGRQGSRKGGIFERISGDLFYTVFNHMTDGRIEKNLITARLMTRRYVDALLQHQEREVFLAGLWMITGFEQVSMVVEKLQSSPTTYSIRKKISILLNSISSFSNRPLYFILYTGLLISFASIILALYAIYNWAFVSNEVTGWTSLIASVWLIGGIQIFFIGIIGIYISKIFTETKRRPYTIVRHVYEH